MNEPVAQAQAKKSLDGLTYATCSHVGLKRQINQDSFASRVSEPTEFKEHGHLFVVADGMGAHAAGELASRLAVEEISTTKGPQNHADQLKVHFQKANAIIHEQGQSNPQLYNMGTTCSALWLLDYGALVSHVGDSRVYRCRANRIEQLTFDHSLVWEMRAAGQYTSDSANTVPRNVITRCLGPHPHVEVDLDGPFSVQNGDMFLLCSDGLTGRIEDSELGVALRYLSPVDASEFLVDLANLRGGHDNITATVVEITGANLQAEGSAEWNPPGTRGTHPAVWFLAGIGMVVALIATNLSSVPGMIGGAATVGVAFLILLTQWLETRRQNSSAGGIPRPPYAVANAEFVERILTQFVGSLQEQSNVDDATIREVSELAAEPWNDKDPTILINRIRNLAQRIRQIEQ